MISIPKYEIDWTSGRIRAPDIPRDIVERKFDLWDQFVESFYISRGQGSPGFVRMMRENKDWPSIVEVFDTLFKMKEEFSDAEKSSLGQLLADDTIFAYAILRWENQPIMLRYYQDAFLSDNHKRIDNESSNQSGKSFSLCVKASVKFMKNHGKNVHIGLISKSMPQNSMNMRMVRKMLKDASVKYNPGSNDNMTVMIHELDGKLTNTLVCSVASTSALGFPFDFLLLDEFEFWENPEGLEYMYDQVLEPRTFHTKGQIVIYSNPNGKNFVSENLHKRKVKVHYKYRGSGMGVPQKTRPNSFTEEYQFHVYNVNFLDVPSNTREEWDTKKAHTHPIMFASTMAAERTESEGAALTETDIKKTFSDDLDSTGFHGEPIAWFLDLGFVYDQSVLVGCYLRKNDDGQVIYNFAVKCYPQQHPHNAIWGFEDSHEDSVPNVVKRFSADDYQFELDLTGKEGNELNAQRAGLFCHGVKMSGPWKATWYDRFITLVKQGRIKVQRIDNWLDTQNKNFEFQARSLRISTKMSDGRSRQYPLYHHTNEKDHDDILDAIVGCLSLVDKDMEGNPGISYIPGEKEQKAEEAKNNKKKKIDDTPYDDAIELAVEKGVRNSLFYGDVIL